MRSQIRVHFRLDVDQEVEFIEWYQSFPRSRRQEWARRQLLNGYRKEVRKSDRPTPSKGKPTTPVRPKGMPAAGAQPSASVPAERMPPVESIPLVDSTPQIPAPPSVPETRQSPSDVGQGAGPAKPLAGLGALLNPRKRGLNDEQ